MRKVKFIQQISKKIKRFKILCYRAAAFKSFFFCIFFLFNKNLLQLIKKDINQLYKYWLKRDVSEKWIKQTKKRKKEIKMI